MLKTDHAQRYRLFPYLNSVGGCDISKTVFLGGGGDGGKAGLDYGALSAAVYSHDVCITALISDRRTVRAAGRRLGKGRIAVGLVNERITETQGRLDVFSDFHASPFLFTVIVAV